MRFRIDLKIFLFIVLYLCTKQIKTYALIMIFALIHELGHLCMGIFLGMKPKKIEIKPFGLSVEFRLTPKDYNKKIGKGNLLEIKKTIVALAGPLTNLIIILIVQKLKIDIINGLTIIYSNLILFFFNMIPIYPLDGGRILKSILYIVFGKMKSDKYINNISFIVLLILTFFSSILIYVMKNISIFIVIIVTWILFIREDIIFKRRNKIYKMLGKSIEIN